METIRLLNQKRYEANEIIDDLRTFLGADFFEGLSAETHRYLQRAEFYFRRLEFDDFGPSINNFQRAYGCDFF